MENEKNNPGLQAILRFAVQQSDGSYENTSTFQEMNAERKAFLESAIKTMTVNLIEEFEKAIATLESPESPTSDKASALNIIREHIDNIDFANSFIKAGGSNTLLHYLASPEKQLRVIAIYIIAEMSQNNPFCQKHFLDAKCIPQLVSYFNEEEEVANSALHAVSSLIRNFPPGLEEFLHIGGIELLLSCINTPCTRVFTKTCFLIANLCSEDHSIREKFIEVSTIERLAVHIDEVAGYDIKTESVLFAIAELSQSEFWQPQREKSEDLSNVLQSIIRHNKSLPQCEEIVEYANRILENLNKPKNVNVVNGGRTLEMIKN